MENIAGTAGVSGAETHRERGSEDRLLEKCGKCKNGVKPP